MSYQLLFQQFNYRRSTTLSKTLQAFKARGTTSGQWYSLSKQYYISPLVYCMAWQNIFDTDGQLDNPLEYYDLIPDSYDYDSDDLQNSFIPESIVQKRPKKKRRASKKVNFNRRRT